VAIFPAQIHDCKAALRWLRANASDFGYNAERVVVAGSSAGGQLAALMATSGGVKELEGNLGIHLEESSRVQGAIDFFGATDFVLRSKTQPHRANAKGSVVYLYFGGGADEKVALAKLASAAYQVTSDDPPLLVFHGDKDNTVLIDQSEKITEVYKKAQLPIEFYVLKGAGHGGKRFHGTETRDKILNFLNRIFKAE
jgi:acetyl esterase/lipase